MLLINTKNLTPSKKMLNFNVFKNILVKHNEDTTLSCHIHVPLSCNECKKKIFDNSYLNRCIIHFLFSYRYK